MDKTTQIERFKEKFAEIAEGNIVALWNEYCQDNNYADEEIHCNDGETIRMIWGEDTDIMDILYDFLDPSAKDYSLKDTYLCVNWNKVPTSFNDPTEAPGFDLDALADWVIDTDYSLEDYLDDEDIDYIFGIGEEEENEDDE